ncbi:MAG: tyrosine-protein phosphatase [Janthinobacterium lividum]
MRERHVSPLQGAFNFRDLGGLPTRDGRRVRTSVLFRSDTLQAVTPHDVALLVQTLGVRLVVDLRVGEEAVTEGRGLLSDAEVCYLNVPLGEAPASSAPGTNQALRFYLAHLEAPASPLPLLLRMLASVAGEPTVVHCAAGKDRTGLVTALLLQLLGVDDDVVVDDYLATAHNLPRITERFQTWPRYRAHMASVAPEVYLAEEHTMRGFLGALHQSHGGAREWALTRGVPAAALDALHEALVVD